MDSITDQNFQPAPMKSTGSKYAIQEEIINEWKRNTQFKLYHPENDFSVSCCCAFFLVDSEWDKDSLRTLKEQTSADLLVGIKTSDKSMVTDNVIDAIVCCEMEQVDRIVHQFQAMLSVHGSYIAMDINDIINFFNQCPYTQYAESKLYLSNDFIENNKQEIEEFIAKLLVKDVKNLLLYTHTINPAGLEQFSKIAEIVDRQVDDSDMALYGMATTSTLNYAYISLMYPQKSHHKVKKL